jgi:hypothetical protein
MIREDQDMTPQDEELYRLGYADAIAGREQQLKLHPAYLGGYGDGLADKAEQS